MRNINSRFEKARGYEQMLRVHIGKIAKLEGDYAATKTVEIISKLSVQSPFLASRGIEREIKEELKRAKACQKLCNKYLPPDNQIDLFEQLIENNAVFVQSKRILAESAKHSIRTKAGIAAMKGNPFQGGPSVDDLFFTDEERRLIERTKNLGTVKNDEKLKEIMKEQEEMYANLLASSPRPVETDNTEEETEENGQTDNN